MLKLLNQESVPARTLPITVKSLSQDKSRQKSKNASEAEKKTLTSMGGSSKHARLRKVKSPKSKKFISSSEESSSSESSDSNSGNSSDEDEVDWKPEKVLNPAHALLGLQRIVKMLMFQVHYQNGRHLVGLVRQKS